MTDVATPGTCPSHYASTAGTTAGAVVACRQTGQHIVHSNLADNPADRVVWISGDDNELIRLRCDWCRRPGVTHTADEHPLPKDHPDYDAFFDASDDELVKIATCALGHFGGNHTTEEPRNA